MLKFTGVRWCPDLEAVLRPLWSNTSIETMKCIEHGVSLKLTTGRSSCSTSNYSYKKENTVITRQTSCNAVSASTMCRTMVLL